MRDLYSIERICYISHHLDMILGFKFYGNSCEARKNAKDCIEKEYIYCSSWQFLNDPMEGIYWWDGKSNFKSLYDEKKKLKIGCLSSIYREPLLWGYYGAGMHGVCIVYDVRKIRTLIKDVKYVEDLRDTNNGGLTIQEKAKWLLCRKLSGWIHEQERRIITDEEKVDCPVVGILIGDKMKYAEEDGSYVKRDTAFHQELMELAIRKTIFAGAVRFNEPKGIVLPEPRNEYREDVFSALISMPDIRT